MDPAPPDPGRPLRVLAVTNMYPTRVAPMFGIFVAEQVSSLRRRGVGVDVLLVNGAEEGAGAYLAGFLRLRRELARRRYDLVHAHYVFSGILAIGQRYLAGRGRRPPVVLTHHGIETQVGWTAPLCRWASRRAARTIATSRRVRDALGRPDAEIVPCGIDIDLFRPGPRAEARAALGLPAAAPLVLFAGVRRPEKRLGLIEAAVAQLRTARPDVRLVVAEGEPHERMPLYMNACDVLILASVAEGSPMVVKEAMACNLPIVSVDVGDVAEVIGDTAGCQVVAAGVDALAGGLARALAFGGRTNGRDAILPLALDAIAGRLEAIYRDVVAPGAATGG